jgi:hypothetical protein
MDRGKPRTADDYPSSVDVLRQSYREALEENARLKLLLCALTPGGSEFVDSPENCVAWVQERERSKHEIIVRQVKRIRELEAENARLRLR